ncbi:ATP-binding protein [Rhizobium ruizarguesonis]|uniref:ATP-binding protein n=1 Tax=Rhizobium ruizarguesonis TaxID=2081791 RepID=UPI0010300991|nr:adenylate kinase [Rhizobium ruizarguesonis]MBY5854592.1 adenylate kinase [Rhizobium leguminosarum]QND22956.1 adenylate kinase [Rhizobium leguminosarum bv. viciae]MBY5889582.1 adenylate kinase [Rhizobium leguminosarum]QSZ00559.1 adenylate kinase [Rhizobium ruizarguesonis]TAY81253.1 adenylate kinase [Rhizobium ruizarguesonis]
MVHIHVMGASGSGTTSRGRALAEKLDIAHLDTDDFFWLPTDPPFTTPRDAGERIRLLLDEVARHEGWVLSGSALKWGRPIEPFYDLIVFLRIDPRLRMTRILAREIARYGNRIKPGGDMAVKSGEFLEWAASYDTAGPERRSLAAHEQWLETRTAPVLWLDSSLGIDDLAAEVLLHPVIAAGAVRRRP